MRERFRPVIYISLDREAILSVVVAHPARQHSHQVAAALYKAAMLSRYWTGVPCLPEHERFLPNWVRKGTLRQPSVHIPLEMVTWNPIASIMRRGGKLLLGAKYGAWFEYSGYAAFDSWAAARLARNPPVALIGYENAAVRTFRAARGKGVYRILDAAAIHHTAQDKASGYLEPTSLHRYICRVKDEEIALADHILSPSTLAMQTYVQAGVSPNKISVVPLGADIDVFYPETARHFNDAIKFRFVFVGHICMHKGFDLLVQAFSAIAREAQNIELVIVGAMGNAAEYLSHAGNQARYIGKLSQSELRDIYTSADCLVLPSRHDSYGMVIAEALACGTPVIVSDMVGAKDWVVQGENGWVIPFNDSFALEQRMRWCIENWSSVRAMRTRARDSAQGMSWSAYSEKLVQTVKDLLNSKRPQASHLFEVA